MKSRESRKSVVKLVIVLSPFENSLKLDIYFCLFQCSVIGAFQLCIEKTKLKLGSFQTKRSTSETIKKGLISIWNGLLYDYF